MRHLAIGKSTRIYDLSINVNKHLLNFHKFDTENIAHEGFELSLNNYLIFMSY